MDVRFQRQSSRLERVVSFVFALLVFLTLRPYFVWHSKIIYGFVVVQSIIFFLLWLYYKSNISKNYLVISIIYLIMIFLSQFTFDSLQPWLSVLVPLTFLVFMFDSYVLRLILNNFINIYVIFMILPIVLFFLVSSGWRLEWVYLAPYSNAKDAAGVFYRQYFGMVILNTQIFSFGKGELFRLSGVFPEPGVVGTLAALLLTIMNYNLRKLRECIIFISGILSFSLTFYMLSFIYLSVKKPLTLIKLMIVFLLLIYTLPSDLKENRLLKYYFFERMEAVLYDFEAIDNREDNCFKAKYTDFLLSSDVLLGRGYKATIKLNCDTSSYKNFIYDYGMINLIILAFLYIAIVLSRMTRYSDIVTLLPFLLVCIASSYQRPAFDQLWFILLFLCGLASLVNCNSTARDRK